MPSVRPGSHRAKASSAKRSSSMADAKRPCAEWSNIAGYTNGSKWASVGFHWALFFYLGQTGLSSFMHGEAHDHGFLILGLETDRCSTLRKMNGFLK